MIRSVNGNRVVCSSEEESIITNFQSELSKPMTAQELDMIKVAKVEIEFTPAILAIVTAIDPINAASIIAQAKASRKAEM